MYFEWIIWWERNDEKILWKYELYYEGEYLNGNRNEKGKIYLKEFLNREKNGEGKKYNQKGKLDFEGEFLYNERLFGKEFHQGKLEYEGEYLYGKKFNGKGYDYDHYCTVNLVASLNSESNMSD